MQNAVFQPLAAAYDAALAALIRRSLEAHDLARPGTAYFDTMLDRLSAFYSYPRRAYFILLQEEKLIGGIGLAEYEGFEECCELQKLYLAPEAQGQGLGYAMIRRIEEKARELDYRRIYLETHTDLAAAVHIYERSGYREIPRPGSAVHSGMNRFYLKELSLPAGEGEE